MTTAELQVNAATAKELIAMLAVVSAELDSTLRCVNMVSRNVALLPSLESVLITLREEALLIAPLSDVLATTRAEAMSELIRRS
jgi:hypothetical protein